MKIKLDAHHALLVSIHLMKELVKSVHLVNTPLFPVLHIVQTVIVVMKH